MEQDVRNLRKANAVTDMTDPFVIAVTRAHARACNGSTKQPVTSVTDTREADDA
jgi:hypothetical protein